MESLLVVLGIIGPQEIVFFLILSIVLIPLWLLPIFISRGKENSFPIMLITLFLGWTFLGWFGAIIWAIVSPKKGMNLPFVYVCRKCRYKKGFEQDLKMFKCPQCSEENYRDLS